MVISAVIIKHKLCLSDEETVQQIRENFYQQYFVGFPAYQEKLILDATVAEQAIRFPTDLSLLNESREISERIIDVLHSATGAKAKPRTYPQMARKDYLSIVKQRRPKGKKLRAGIK